MCIRDRRGTYTPFQVFGHPELKGMPYTFVPESIPGMSKNPKCLGLKCYGMDLRNKYDEAVSYTHLNSGRYKAQRDKNYQKDSLQNDRDKREQELDSLKSTFYAGESSVSYNLKDRYARFLPIPVFKCEYGGKVVVEILVNPKGVVQKAKILEDQSQSDDCLRCV